MRRLITGITVLALLVLLTSCKGGATDTTINSSGGSAKLKDTVEFIFAANAADKEVNVKLQQEQPTGLPVPEGSNSDLVSLVVDAGVKSPVTVRVKLKDSAAVEGNRIGLGSVVKNSYGVDVLDFRYIDATIEDGYAIGTFIPSEYSSDGAAVQKAMVDPFSQFKAYAAETVTPKSFKTYVGVFTCAAYYKEGGHFKVYYPGVARFSEGQQLVDDLEFFYNAMLENGYSYSQRTKWPFEVYIKAIDNEAEYCESGWFGRNVDTGYMNLNKNHWITGYKRDSARPLLVHEWFHFVQANYTAGGTDSDWFDDATATAYETKILKSTPSIVNEYFEKMWQGVIPVTDTAQDGYARAPIIEFLAKRYADRNFMLDAYVGMSKGVDAESAILASTGDPSEWVKDCYRSLTTGEFGSQNPAMIYKYVQNQDAIYSTFGGLLNMALPEKDIIEQASEDGLPVPIGEGTCTLKPYGAHFFAIQMSEDELKKLGDGMTLLLDADLDGAYTLDAYLIDSKNKFVLKPSDELGITVTDLKKALSGGNRILLLLTNLQSADTDVVIKANLVMYPTLDELVGEYKDGKMIFEKIYFSEAIINEATAKAAQQTDEPLDFSGCDIEMINAMKAMEGQEKPAVFKIEKTGEDTGQFSLIIYDEGEPSDPLLMNFTYMFGQLSIDMYFYDSRSNFLGSLMAAYGKNADVLIEGMIKVTGDEKPDEAFIDLRLKGSKPLTQMP